MTTKKLLKCFKPLPLALAVAAGSSHAFEASVGDVDIQVGTSISYGVAWRTEDPDANNVAKYGTEGLVDGGGKASTYNYDDGTLNFEKGDAYTNVVKANVDVEINYDDMGAFLRGKAFYDSAIMDTDPAWKEFNDETKDSAGSGYDLLDAFVWYNFDLGDTPVSARLGRQVVSWGESTFIQGGINSINPIDASAARKPGVEVKEVLLPVNMAYTSLGITDNVSVEGFYQLQWEKTRIDGCGSFFSTNDFVADGCGPVVLAGDAGEKTYMELRQEEIDAGNIPLANRSAPMAEREADVKAKNEGQYGLALRWYSEELGDTEFGLFFMNIHSRTPYIAGKARNVLAVDSDNDGVNDTALNPNREATAFPTYRIEYPEDIKLTGISFNTATEGGWSVGGELSLTQDRPIQHNAFEVLYAGNLLPQSKLLQQRYKEATGITLDVNDPAAVLAAQQTMAGQSLPGYDLFDIYQAQVSFIKFFDQILGASRLSFVSEIGATYIQDFPGLDEARYGRAGTFGIGSFDPVVAAVDTDGSLTGTVGTPVAYYTCDASEAGSVGGGVDGASATNENPDNCTTDGFVDELSGGVRIRASLDYPNALAGVNLKPKLALGYDIGNGPEPGSQFIDGRIQTSLGLDFDYLNTYSGGVSYTMYDGGDYNVLKDRDNVSLNLKVVF